MGKVACTLKEPFKINLNDSISFNQVSRDDISFDVRYLMS